MAQPFPGISQCSSVGVSPGIALDPTARVTNVMLDLTPNWVGTLTIQGSLDVPLSGTTPLWDNISTASYTAANAVDGAMLQLQCPIAGLRLACSAYTSGQATLKALQMIFG